MKISVPVLLISLLVLSSCAGGKITQNKPIVAIEKPDVESIFMNVENDLNIQTPFNRTQKEPLVLVHYMPWFQSPPVSEGYGFHWHLGGASFDPFEVLENGQANIASRYYPLTGPYDTTDTTVLEYQVALMKVSGIDGVIFDWYGINNALDYAKIHESTQAMIKVLKKAGLKFLICYEDQSIGKMVEAGLFKKDMAVEYGKKTFQWMEENWFHDDAYVTFDDKPVVMCFGPQYFMDATQWDALFSVCSNRPYFISLEGHSDGFADGSYNWFSMNGTKTIPELVRQLQFFYDKQNEKPFLAATAFSEFYDIYAKAGLKSYGFLDYYEGKTFNLTLNTALKAFPDIIQIATWNDYGEGTVIEPTIEHGYSELEAIQGLKRGYKDSFSYSPLDLRSPLALFTAIRSSESSAAKKDFAQKALSALLTGDNAMFRENVKKGSITVDFAVRPLLQDPLSAITDDLSLTVFNPGERKNLALGAPVVVTSRIYEFTGNKAVDGDINTYWEGATDSYPNEISVDIVTPKNLDCLVIKLNPQKIWGKREQKFEVQISTDGEVFTTLIPATVYKFDPVENGNTICITLNVTAQVIKVICTENTGGTAGQIAELQIYEISK